MPGPGLKQVHHDQPQLGRTPMPSLKYGASYTASSRSHAHVQPHVGASRIDSSACLMPIFK
jgi:hypothetical protein